MNNLWAHLNLWLVLFFYSRHPERSEGSADRDFSPTAQNDGIFRHDRIKTGHKNTAEECNFRRYFFMQECTTFRTTVQRNRTQSRPSQAQDHRLAPVVIRMERHAKVVQEIPYSRR